MTLGFSRQYRRPNVLTNIDVVIVRARTGGGQDFVIHMHIQYNRITPAAPDGGSHTIRHGRVDLYGARAEIIKALAQRSGRNKFLESLNIGRARGDHGISFRRTFWKP